MRRSGARGQALVELAVVMPVVLLVLLAILEFGLMFYAYLTVAHAAREGARTGIVPGATDADIRQRVYEAASELPQERVSVSISPPQGARYAGDPLTVQVSYRYPVLIPLLAAVLGSEVDLTGVYSMRIE